MKISELIKDMQEAQEKHGDKEVLLWDNRNGVHFRCDHGVGVNTETLYKYEVVDHFVGFSKEKRTEYTTYKKKEEGDYLDCEEIEEGEVFLL